MLAVSLLRIWNETMSALVTTGYALFHIGAQAVCAIVLLIILNHQLNTSTQTEARTYFVRALFAQFVYCITSVFRVLVNINVISNSPTVGYTILALNFMAMHVAAWLAFVYVETSQKSWLLGSIKNKLITAIPLFIEAAIFIFSPVSGVSFSMATGSLKIGSLFTFMMFTAPLYYLVATILAVIRRSKMTRYERDTNEMIEIYPAVLFVFISLQAINWKVPLFCYAIMIADVFVYIKYADSLVSIDPLTKILNRNGITFVLADELKKLNDMNISDTIEVGNVEEEDEDAEKPKDLYVFAVDVDDLGSINSSYGRMDGDKVLITVAEALKSFADEAHECYIGRYHGDEFMLVAQIQDAKELDMFAEHVRNYISNAAITNRLPYHLHVNIGWAKYERFTRLETVSGLIEEAAKNLNENKEQKKFQNFWERKDLADLGGGIRI